MDYKKLNTISTDGQGNIILQDIHANNILINKFNTAELEQLLSHISKAQLITIGETIESQNSETKAIIKFVQKELHSRRRKSKILGIALFLAITTCIITAFLAYQIYMEDFGFTVLCEPISNTKIQKGELYAHSSEDTYFAPISLNGKASFKNISAKYKNKDLLLSLSHETFQTAMPDSLYSVFPNCNLKLMITYKNLDYLTGTVRNQDNEFLNGIKVGIENIFTTTDENGRFNIEIPTKNQKPEQILTVNASGFETYQEYVYPAKKSDIGVLLKAHNTTKLRN